MTGRPSIYSTELGREICRRMISGRSLTKICLDDDMPAESTVYDWVADGAQGIEPFVEFSERYTRARELQAEKALDECVDIADDSAADYSVDEDGVAVLNSEAVQRSRLRVETRLKVIEKLAPKKYGAKIQQEVTGKDGSPLIPVTKEQRDAAVAAALAADA